MRIPEQLFISERFFKPGSLARFSPPPGAYSNSSEQSRRAGEACIVTHVWNDSMATVTFGDGAPIVVTQDYLHRL